MSRQGVTAADMKESKCGHVGTVGSRTWRASSMINDHMQEA